jgi:hypothetical protein
MRSRKRPGSSARSEARMMAAKIERYSQKPRIATVSAEANSATAAKIRKSADWR